LKEPDQEDQKTGIIDGEKLPPVLVILGPTGVGKTGASVLFARHLDTEIIGADSMQIYRAMDIGTAKPDATQRNAVIHHMIDIVDPSEEFSAGKYVEQVVSIIDGLQERKRVPIVVGGTGLYIKAMTRGLFEAPDADWDLRGELLAVEKEEPGSLYKRLTILDPDRAKELIKTDIRRIVRALEVCIRSGKPMSELHRELTRPLRYDFIKIGLTREREELYRMIDARVDTMIEQGFVEEVQKLLTMDPGRTPLQAIGYKEMIRHLSGDVSLDEAKRLIKRDSRRYAKRQYTWFRKEPDIQWIDITGMFDEKEISNLIISECSALLDSVS
jgi:tRNA dimethylallyltransferase